MDISTGFDYPLEGAPAIALPEFNIQSPGVPEEHSHAKLSESSWIIHTANRPRNVNTALDSCRQW